jgi:PKD repeat protein
MKQAISLFLLFHIFQGFAQIDPASLPGLELWISADIGLTTNLAGEVSQWNDQSGNNRNLTQSTANRRPLHLQNHYFGKSSVKFDGINDYMDFPAITNIRTVFWVLAESATPSAGFKCLLGHSTSYDFIRGDNGTLWNTTFGDPNILNGTTRVGFNDFNGTVTPLPSGHQVVSLQTLANVEADRFNRDRTFNATVWDGELLQLLIFSSELSPEEVQGVEQYLLDYYTPEFSLGNDIQIDDNFCDTTLTASAGFQSYLWSTGSQENQITVQEDGWYWVEAQGPFGTTLRDSIYVEYPGNVNLQNSQICAGESYAFDTNLNPDLFTFLWHDESTLPLFSTEDEGEISVLISDNQGCSYFAGPALLSVDYFSEEAGLGPDTALCIGESFGLAGGEAPGLNYLWSNDSELPFYIYNGESEVSVQVTNLNNCIATDTIQITSNGQAPTADFSYNGQCFGDNTEFLNQSLFETEIISYEWIIDNLAIHYDENTSFEFPQPGIYEVALFVTDLNGCSGNSSEWIEIFHKPQASFQYTYACEGETVTFFDNSIIDSGIINSWEWTFENGTQNGVFTEYVFNDPGFFPVNLTVTSENQCSDDITVNVSINPAPDVTITFSDPCYGSLTAFDTEIEENNAGPAVTYFWAFGDATSSNQPQPQHLYPNPGFYNVYVEITAENGCSNSNTSALEVFALPQLNMETGPACTGEITYISDNSYIESDPITDWFWEVESQGNFYLSTYEATFAEAGSYEVSLSVETAAGCTAQEDFEINVFDNPQIDFGYSPPIGAAPLEFSFNAASNVPCDFIWDFGQGFSSTGANVTHFFESNELYTVTLVATSENGCTSAISRDVNVTEPLLDIVINNLFLNADNSVTANVTNAGNFQIQGIWMFQRADQGPWIKEFWPIELQIGQTQNFTFNAQIPLKHTSVLCALANNSDNTYEDINLLNNEYCITLSSPVEFGLFPVYPNPASSIINVGFIMPIPADVSLEIYNDLGQLIEKANHFANEGYNRLYVDVLKLSGGIYTLSLSYNDQQLISRFMRE